MFSVWSRAYHRKGFETIDDLVHWISNHAYRHQNALKPTAVVITCILDWKRWLDDASSIIHVAGISQARVFKVAMQHQRPRIWWKSGCNDAWRGFEDPLQESSLLGNEVPGICILASMPATQPSPILPMAIDHPILSGLLQPEVKKVVSAEAFNWLSALKQDSSAYLTNFPPLFAPASHLFDGSHFQPLYSERVPQAEARVQLFSMDDDLQRLSLRWSVAVRPGDLAVVRNVQPLSSWTFMQIHTVDDAAKTISGSTFQISQTGTCSPTAQPPTTFSTADIITSGFHLTSNSHLPRSTVNFIDKYFRVHPPSSQILSQISAASSALPVPAVENATSSNSLDMNNNNANTIGVSVVPPSTTTHFQPASSDVLHPVHILSAVQPETVVESQSRQFQQLTQPDHQLQKRRRIHKVLAILSNNQACFK